MNKYPSSLYAVALIAAAASLTGCTSDELANHLPTVAGGVIGLVGGPAGVAIGATAGYSYEQGERNDRQDKKDAMQDTQIAKNAKDTDMLGEAVADFYVPASGDPATDTPTASRDWRKAIAQAREGL